MRNASERRFSFARICPLYNYSLQSGIFNICSRLAEEAVIKFIPLKQLEEMHVADESILYDLFEVLSDKQVFRIQCLLSVSQGEMILSH